MILAAAALPDPRAVAPDGTWQAAAYDASFRAIRAAGYRYFELSRTRRLTADTAAAIRDRAEASGLRAVALHEPALHGPDALKRQLRIASAAAMLGAPLLVFHVSSLRFAARDREVRKHTRAADAVRVRAVAEFAAEREMRVALENASRREHPDYLRELCEQVGLPNVGIAFDTGHANLRGASAPTVAAALASVLIHTHLHDNRGLRDEHLPPGRGTIDWPRLAGALVAAEYSGAWCVELKGQAPSRQEMALREARLFLEALKIPHEVAMRGCKG